MVKRLIDIAGAAFGLLLLSPLLAVVALLVWILLGRPVSFVQERPGRNCRPFKLVKFRTMRTGPGSDAERLTWFGSLLRKTSIDELPELWNVLMGEMSLVGPRPLLVKYLPYYTERERLRFRVRPGITGLAQVSGRNMLDWDARLELDAQYAQRMKFREDMKIVLKTFVVVVTRDGLSVDTRQVEPALDEIRGKADTCVSNRRYCAERQSH
jgi:undecaprenyl phosphate N,N'-diacetylbacillosamine 1-phosphate transferase